MCVSGHQITMFTQQPDDKLLPSSSKYHNSLSIQIIES